MGGNGRTVKAAEGAQYDIPECAFNFEQFGWLCQAGVEAQAEGVVDTGVGASGYIYTFDFGMTSVPTITTLTVEAGNNQDADEMQYSFCPSFTVRGEPNGLCMMSGQLLGRQRTDCSFTSLTPGTVHEAPFNLAALAIDNAGAAFGTTAVAGYLLGFNISVDTGFRPVQTGDGALYFYDTEYTGYSIRADVTFKHENTADTEHDAWLAQTIRRMQIKLQGASLSGAGDVYSLFTCAFNLPGKWEKFSTYQSRDGYDVLTGTFRAAYDATATASGPQIVLVNEKSSYWTP